LPRRSIPDKTSSVVDVDPNMFVIVLVTFSSLYAELFIRTNS